MDYKKAYYKLYKAITLALEYQEKSIEILKNIQVETEYMYIENEEKLIIFHDPNHVDE